MRNNAFVTALALSGEGRHIAGIYGVDVPREILWAMDIVPINVFGIDGSNIEAAEKFMDKKSCSLLKASYGYVITDRCPFSHFADVIIGTDYCRDKECMLYKLKNLKNVYIINEYKNAHGLASEYKNFIYFLQRKFGIKLDENKLASAIKKTNAVGLLIQEITDIYMRHPGIMGCHDLEGIIYGSQFIFDLDRRLDKLYQLKEALDSESSESDVPFDARRILITGPPLSGFRDEILKPLSSLNHAILTLSCCEGESYKIIDESSDLYYGLSQKYAAESLGEKLSLIVSKYNIDAVINVKIKGCNLQNEDYKHAGIPYFSITVDYNRDNYNKVLLRIKLFIDNIQ